jgi:hypothetical protein
LLYCPSPRVPRAGLAVGPAGCLESSGVWLLVTGVTACAGRRFGTGAVVWDVVGSAVASRIVIVSESPTAGGRSEGGSGRLSRAVGSTISADGRGPSCISGRRVGTSSAAGGTLVVVGVVVSSAACRVAVCMGSSGVRGRSGVGFT